MMAALPSRAVMDTLVAEFFSVPDMGCCEFVLMSKRELH
jgi:hypothetical protein